ncbi:hypothetical protein PCC9214_05759 [Planktothrix tepida]|uniref:Uncharacterized protein n=1 Tax=Planktothrix tepida PCC 9214 TaxID=671072 RepID=A0A1J1LSS7_9CYAN|nr:hypothetical protein [Planktothrix tepida]CAD5990285.1 hypothetical protein PCC9214_05759 [Planktothrix tepida]CUR35656.1 conserved exported hypothetical protein [Planktothrix tepida PCC 9214]
MLLKNRQKPKIIVSNHSINSRYRALKLVYRPQNIEPKPPRSFLWVGRWFRFGVALFLFLSMLLGTSGCSSNSTSASWLKATEIVPVDLVKRVITENSQLNPEEVLSSVNAFTVKGKAGQLIVFSFNHQGVCGKAKCLYVGYLISKNTTPVPVLATYLNPNLPPQTPLFKIMRDPSLSSDLPCLQIQQSMGKSMRQSKWCFNNHQYQIVQTSVIESTAQQK